MKNLLALFLVMFTAMVLNAQITFKKELVVIYEEFDVNNWTVLSLSENDTADSFALNNIKSRSPFNSMAIMASFPFAQDEWIISPKLDFSGSTNTPILIFYEDHDFWYQSKATHEILYALVDNPQAEDFTSLQTFKLENHIIQGFLGSSVQIPLDGLAGQATVHIAFRYISEENEYDDNWYIDDITISQNVLYDGSIIYSSLKDKSKLSALGPTPLTVHPQNRGLEMAEIPVVAQLFDFRGGALWSDTLVTGELESWGKDTLLFSLPQVMDSSYFELRIYADLASDQARNNDTLSIRLNTFVSSRPSVCEVFLNSSNYFSEGPALIVDSLSKIETSDVIPIWHFPFQDDALYAPISGSLARELSVSRTSTLILDRQTRYYEPYTSVQDWQKRVAVINTQVGAHAAEKSVIEIAGRAIKNPADSVYSINFEIIQTANHPLEAYELEIWAVEDRKAYTWLRIDTLYHRAMDRIYRQVFSTGLKDSTILLDSLKYKFPSDGSILFSPPDSSVMVLLVKDLAGHIINATNFRETALKAPATGIEDNDYKARSFSISGNYPNPFNPSTSVIFNLPVSGQVDIQIFSVTGHRVYAEVKVFNSGRNRWAWNADQMSSGTYFVLMKFKSMTRVHKILLVK